MKTTARRNRAELPFRPHRAVCAIKIRNNSDEQLECNRFCLRVDHMSLYMRDERLFTSGVSVVHSAADQEQTLSYMEKRPDETHLGDMITPARSPVSGSILHKSIASMRLSNFLRPDWL